MTDPTPTERLAARIDAALDKYAPGSHPDLAQAIAEHIAPAPDLVFVRRDSGGVFPDGTTNTPAIEFGADPSETPVAPDLIAAVEALPHAYCDIDGGAHEELVERRKVLALLRSTSREAEPKGAPKNRTNGSRRGGERAPKVAERPDWTRKMPDPMRTRVLKRIVMARDGRAEGLRIKRFSAAREAELLAYAASVPDEDILEWRDAGPAVLRWIRTHQTFVPGVATGGNDETPIRLIPDAVVGSTFAEVIKNTGWRVELFWNEAGRWFTARLISRTDRDGHGAYPGGYLAPFDDPIGASGATPWEALANLSEAVLEWA